MATHIKPIAGCETEYNITQYKQQYPNILVLLPLLPPLMLPYRQRRNANSYTNLKSVFIEAACVAIWLCSIRTATKRRRERQKKFWTHIKIHRVFVDLLVVMFIRRSLCARTNILILRYMPCELNAARYSHKHNDCTAAPKSSKKKHTKRKKKQWCDDEKRKRKRA